MINHQQRDDKEMMQVCDQNVPPKTEASPHPTRRSGLLKNYTVQRRVSKRLPRNTGCSLALKVRLIVISHLM